MTRTIQQTSSNESDAIPDSSDPFDTARRDDPSLRLSFSALNLHRQCPQAWAYRYVRGLTRPEDDVIPAADLGSWWHALRAVDAVRRGLDLGSLRHSPRTIRTGSGPTLRRDGEGPTLRYRVNLRQGVRTLTLDRDTVLSLAEAFWRSLDGESRETWEERLGVLPERLDYLDARWTARWADEIRHEAPVAAELGFTRAIPGSRAVVPGYVDEVYLDTRRHLVVARDYKTSRALEASDSNEDLMDPQLHLYAWGAAPQLEEWGYRVSAVAYDRTRSVAPKTPVLTQSGGLSKSVSDFDLYTYVTWAQGVDGEGVPWGEEGTYVKSGKRAGEPKWGRYTAEQGVIDRLSSPASRSVWHQRTLVPLNRNVIRAHLQATADTAGDAARTVERMESSGEAGRNLTRASCRFCDYASLCRAEMLGGPGDYDPRDFGLALTSPAGR